MRNLSDMGRIFYGIATMVTGFQIIYYHDFPYWLLPPTHVSMPGLAVVAYISGILFVLAGACIVFKKRTRTISLLSGVVLLLIFCFYYIPYQFMDSSRYMHLLQWDNAGKELAFASGAFVIAGCFSEKNKKQLIRFGSILFSITIISFG